MSLEAAEAEVRQRFSEASMVLNHLRAIAPDGLQPIEDLQKSLRALCLVSIYAAVERSANAIIEAAFEELTSHQAPCSAFIPSMHGLLHYSKVQSLRDCGSGSVFDKSTELFGAAFEGRAASFVENPLSDRMQNVDGGTLEWLASLFGVSGYACDRSNKGRLGNLRERRNAVAHGRESASVIGGRFTIVELANIYNAADIEIARFLLAIREQCDGRRYTRQVA